MAIVLIATGGTIASTTEIGAPVPTLKGASLAQGNMQVVDFATKPSGHFQPQDWLRLHQVIKQHLAVPEIEGVIVTHGTDALEEMSFFLEATLRPAKRVVITGAQRNASEADADGPRNIADAAMVIRQATTHNVGVRIVFDGAILQPRFTEKIHSFSPRAFFSPETGALGRVAFDRVVWYQEPMDRPVLLPQLDERVLLSVAYAGATGDEIRAHVAAGGRGVVIEGLGLGNVNPQLYAAIKVAREAGVEVVIASTVRQGPAVPHYGYAGGGATLYELGCHFAGLLQAKKARILLMLALGNQMDQPSIRSLFCD